MSEFINITLLAVLQGVAEFLPISSSGHLVVGQHLLGMQTGGLRVNVVLHFGTLLAVAVYYRARLARMAAGVFGIGNAREERCYVLKLIVGALPAVPVYFLFKGHLDAMTDNTRMVGAFLMFTGAVLLGTRYLPRGTQKLTFGRALLMGVAQAIALLPGVSRSGTTLASARAGRVETGEAAAFSFLMSAPLIAGGAMLETVEIFTETAPQAGENVSPWLLAWGAALAAAVGYASLAWLVKLLSGKNFWMFGVYCMLAGLAVVCFLR